MDFIAIIGAITGIISLIGVIYALGYKFGRVELRLDFLWKIYVEDEMVRQRAHDRMGASEWHILEKGEQALPDDIKVDIERMVKKCQGTKNTNPNLLASIPDIANKIGIPRMREAADKSGTTVQGVVALIYAYAKKISCSR